jgi:hypothetical protein
VAFVFTEVVHQFPKWRSPMRHLLLTVLIVFGNLTHVAAQTMLIMAPFTYPEFGTFCGFLKLCPKVVEPSDDT